MSSVVKKSAFECVCGRKVVRAGVSKRRKFYKCAQRRLLRCFGHDQNLRVVSIFFYRIPPLAFTF